MPDPMLLYTWATPNGRKASIMLEELGLVYEVRSVDLSKGQQRDPDFLQVNPLGKIPVLVDFEGPDGAAITLFESSAILIYLAEKTATFLPKAGTQRYETLKWLMLQTAGIGPLCGQGQAFSRFLPEKNDGAIAHFRGLAQQLFAALDARLVESEFLAGPDYSIADIATWPWVSRHSWYGVDLESYQAVSSWHAKVGQRPAVQRGAAVPGDDSLVAAQLKR